MKTQSGWLGLHCASADFAINNVLDYWKRHGVLEIKVYWNLDFERKIQNRQGKTILLEYKNEPEENKKSIMFPKTAGDET